MVLIRINFKSEFKQIELSAKILANFNQSLEWISDQSKTNWIILNNIFEQKKHKLSKINVARQGSKDDQLGKSSHFAWWYKTNQFLQN